MALLPNVPAWVRLGGRLVRCLPAGRYIAMHCLCRYQSSVFMMRMPEELGGYMFRCDLRDAIAREVCFTGRYEPQETLLVQALLRTGMTFVDVGANWGYYTLLAAHLVGPRGRVLSVEPDPRLCAVLQEHVICNDVAHVTVLHRAAATTPGIVTLVGYDEAGGNFGVSRISTNGVKGERMFQATAAPLDAMLAECDLATIDLLKMDIEGAEGLALAGLRQSLRHRRIRRVLLEVHPEQLAAHGHSIEWTITPLREAGYRGWIIDHTRASSRRIAYTKDYDIRSVLRPYDATTALDEWPHMLWVMPGLEALA